MDKVDELEQAILNQADHIARQYQEQARHECEEIHRESNEKIRLNEERAVLVAKSESERSFRRKVQASELKLQTAVDQLRWALILSIEEKLREKVEKLVQNQQQYYPVLLAFIKKAISELEHPEIIVELNQRDYELLNARFDDLDRDTGKDNTIKLSVNSKIRIGGAIIKSSDDKFRIDNSFEGRLKRFQSRLHQRIDERLFLRSRDKVLGG